jgi:hypothetical protein
VYDRGVLRLFWSITVYDTDTRSQGQTDQGKAAFRSVFELKDVSNTQPTELYFGPSAPQCHENHWIKTIQAKRLVRLLPRLWS